MDLISIILPTFNRRTFLSESIGSIQAQTWTNWELIVVDDGSTDGSPDALPADPRISLLQLPHSGNVARLRNAGLHRSHGTLIAFQDSDDRWRPGKLAAQAARLDARRDCGWCYGRFRLIDRDGRIVPPRSSFPWHPREGRFLREVITTEAGVALQTVMVRREIARSVGFDESIPFGDDYDFLLRLAIASPAAVVDQLVAEMTEHADRGSRRRYDQMASFASAYYRAARAIDDPALRRLCRQRARGKLREYLANARASGQLAKGLKTAARTWWVG